MKPFYSPTKGAMSFYAVLNDMVTYIEQSPHDRYRIIVGHRLPAGRRDVLRDGVIIHREGKGARYYWTREVDPTPYRLRQRIFYEASRSLALASELTGWLAENGLADLDVEIHLDIGEHGHTRDLIKEVVGMVVGSGFDARIKPDSYGASKVADKYTK